MRQAKELFIAVVGGFDEGPRFVFLTAAFDARGAFHEARTEKGAADFGAQDAG